jgi:hypothetical protein
MTNEFDEDPGRREGVSSGTGTNDRLYWRASLGQATFELLAAGQVVTTGALIAHLEKTENLDHLVLTRVSTRAAIEVLRALAHRANSADDAGP